MVWTALSRASQCLAAVTLGGLPHGRGEALVEATSEAQPALEHDADLLVAFEPAQRRKQARQVFALRMVVDGKAIARGERRVVEFESRLDMDDALGAIREEVVEEGTEAVADLLERAHRQDAAVVPEDEVRIGREENRTSAPAIFMPPLLVKAYSAILTAGNGAPVEGGDWNVRKEPGVGGNIERALPLPNSYRWSTSERIRSRNKPIAEDFEENQLEGTGGDAFYVSALPAHNRGTGDERSD